MTVRFSAIGKMETIIVPAGYAEHAPPADLASQVVCFWTGLERRSSAPASPVRRVLPDGCVDIILGFGRDDSDSAGELTEAFGIGAMTKPLIVEGPGPRLHIGARFKPGFAFAALGMPASELTDDSIPFDVLARGADHEREQVAAETTDAARLSATIALVRRRLLRARETVVVPRSVRAAVRQILAADGNLRITDLAGDIGITRQQLAKLFATHIGVTPKLLARISRTQRALARADAARAAHPRGVDWSAIACDLGYYDQPHFIDDFKSLTGATPGEWLASPA
jgi:AraC-like DNA-binding protein